MSSGKEKRLTEDNRIAWNQAASRHFKAHDGKYRRLFAQPGYACLEPVIVEKLRQIGLEGKNCAQPACNDGRETLSLINLGAKTATGFDISDEFIAEAKILAEIARLPATFVRTDIYDIPDSFNGQFDLVYISIGALGWMPDLNAFFAVMARLLKTGGELLIYEMHPLLEVFNPDDRDDPLKVVNHYFNDEPLSEASSMDYYGNEKYEAHMSHWFAQSFTKIFGGLLNNGFVIRSFAEYPNDISAVFAHLEQQPLKLPLSYSLHAVRA
jgi:SAM-dependent methyltransferase